MRRADRSARRGTTLLEAVAGLAAVGVVAGSALSVLGGELRTASSVRSSLVAEALASERFSTLRLHVTNGADRLSDSLARGRFAEPFGAFTWRARLDRVASTGNGGAPDLVHLDLVVTGGDGRAELATLLYTPAALGARR